MICNWESEGNKTGPGAESSNCKLSILWLFPVFSLFGKYTCHLGHIGDRTGKRLAEATGIAFSYICKTNWLVDVDLKKYTSLILFFNEKLAKQEKNKIVLPLPLKAYKYREITVSGETAGGKPT